MIILTLFDGDIKPIYHTEVKSKEQAIEIACRTGIQHRQGGLYKGERCLAAWSVREPDRDKTKRIERAFELHS